jgi:hypothetical protein
MSTNQHMNAADAFIRVAHKVAEATGNKTLHENLKGVPSLLQRVRGAPTL